MKKLLLLIVVCFALIVSCEHKYTLEEMQSAIIEQETANLPLSIQHWSDVKNITIDSLVITQKQEPYAGYFVTHWTYTPTISIISATLDINAGDTIKGEYCEQILVEVNGIQTKRGQIYWFTDWDGALWDFLKLQKEIMIK